MISHLDHLEQLCASRAHCLLVEPTFARPGIDDDNLRRIGFSQSLRYSSCDHPRCEILVFSIDELLRASDLIEEQRLDLPDRGLLVEGSASPRNRNINVRESGPKILGPCIIRCCWHRDGLAAGGLPAFPRQLTQRRRDRTIDRHRRIVPRPI